MHKTKAFGIYRDMIENWTKRSNLDDLLILFALRLLTAILIQINGDIFTSGEINLFLTASTVT